LGPGCFGYCLEALFLIDLVIWAKNGKSTLPLVLKQIDKVIPKQVVNNKILIDDHSTDRTPQIGRKFGWNVKVNSGAGISSAANMALDNVETPTFCSFEQDLLLSPDWFSQVYPLILKKNVAVASGIRFPSAPLAVRKLEIDSYHSYTQQLSKGLIAEPFRCGPIDNTVYKTDYLRSLGGFDRLDCNAGHDYGIALKLMKSKKSIWEVNYTVVSLHLRPNSYFYELKHQKWYGTAFREIFSSNKLPLPPWMTMKTLPQVFAFPLTSVKLIIRLHEPSILLYYPAFSLVQLIGMIEGKRYERRLSSS
jgi:glycosyltransferase involved in cell wall biosynthesis